MSDKIFFIRCGFASEVARVRRVDTAPGELRKDRLRLRSTRINSRFWCHKWADLMQGLGMSFRTPAVSRLVFSLFERSEGTNSWNSRPSILPGTQLNCKKGLQRTVFHRNSPQLHAEITQKTFASMRTQSSDEGTFYVDFRVI